MSFNDFAEKNEDFGKKIDFRANTPWTPTYPMNATNDFLKEVESLTVRVLDDIHTPADIDRLSHLLLASSQARSRYAELMIQDSMLHWETSEVLEFEQPVQEAISFPFQPLLASIAAAVVAIFGVWFLKNDASDLEKGQVTSNTTPSAFSPTVSETSGNPKRPGLETADPKAIEDTALAVLEVDGKSPFTRSAEARNEARRGIRILDEKKRFADGGLVQFHGDVVGWNREEHLSVPAEQGILPLEGDDMIKLSRMSIDVPGQSAESSETLRVLDLRDVSRKEDGPGLRLSTSVYFNQGVGLAHGSTEFSLTVHAISSSEGADRSIGHKQSSINSDLNPATWEELASDFEIPEGTDYLLVALNARKEGSQALLPDFGGHYADQLRLNLILRENESLPL